MTQQDTKNLTGVSRYVYCRLTRRGVIAELFYCLICTFALIMLQLPREPIFPVL